MSKIKLMHYLRKYNFNYVVFFELLATFCSLIGVLISLINAEIDGYSIWASRLLYFTAQSNVWLLITFTILLLYRRIYQKVSTYMLSIKIVAVTQITMTCLVYCLILAPFAPKNFNTWSLHNIFTHVLSPLFAIASLLFEKTKTKIRKTTVILCLIPPIIYIVLSALFSNLNLPFGKGANFPYFFMNHHSPSGIFGFYDKFPYYIGSFYWICTFTIIIVFISLLLIKIINSRQYGIDY